MTDTHEIYVYTLLFIKVFDVDCALCRALLMFSWHNGEVVYI